jgi:serine phosphatase RsbU (regulator of sigma subunit)
MEATNDAGQEFGEDRLIEAVRRYRELGSDSLIGALVAEVCRFAPHEQQDDITNV